MKPVTLSLLTGLVALAGWTGSLFSSAPMASQQATRLQGSFTHMRVFSVPGNDSFTVPDGVRRVMVEVRGGGGGGGSGNATNTVGQGGSGGGYGKGIYRVMGGDTLSVSVGDGGLGAVGSCTVGGTGSSSSLGTLISATGGGGGGGCGTSSTPGSSSAPLSFDGHEGRQYFIGNAPENPGGACGDGSTVGQGGNGNAFFGRDGSAGNVVVFW